MKPILYDAAETAFTSNGIGELSDCISCTVEEERNGKYELEMRYPITGKRFSDILHSRLILATPADGKNPQAFRIYQITKPINGIVTVYAEHISYQLSHIPVNPFLEVTSVQTALMTITENVAETCPFTFETTKSSTGKMSLDEPRSVRALLGGTEGSILDCFGGGEYEWDMYTVRLHQNRGTNNGVTLRYGKNITDLEQEESIANTITGVYPYWKGNVDDAEVIVTLPEKVVHSSNYSNYPYPRTITLDCSQQFKEQPTVAQLRSYANSYVSKAGVGIPKVTLTVKFLPLWQSEEYKDIANLERVNLCDTVTVEFPALEVSATAKVIRTKFDVLKERYEEIELGDARTSFTSQVREDIDNAIATTTQKITGVQAVIKKDIKRNSDMITGNKGGYVVTMLDSNGKPQELLIMDTDDVQTAVNVWRFNQGGLGHSHDGYDGPFNDIALTADGHINASMISVGTMNAARIKAGLLQDVAGINYWNMETGEFRLSANTAIGGSTINQHIATANSYTDEQLADYRDEVDAIISDLQEQIDGQIVTYYYDYTPTLSNIPASDWTTEALRKDHEGDIFYNTTNGYAYRFLKINNQWQWKYIEDSAVTEALAKAQEAKDLADKKRRIFVTTPTPPYDKGDLWAQGASGDIKRCMTARASGSYVASDWTKASKYTDDTAVNNLDSTLNQEEIFNRLTNNQQNQGIYLSGTNLYINASMINTGTMSANRMRGGYLRLGGGNYQDSVLQMYDANNQQIGSWTKDGLTVNKGTITGTIITVGGASNESGRLRIVDADNELLGYWDNTGIHVQKGNITGSIITCGGSNNVSGRLRIVDANNDLLGYWDNTGINVMKGSIKGSTITGNTISGGTISGTTITVGSSGDNRGRLRIVDENDDLIGYWDDTGINVKKGTITGTTITASTFEVKGNAKISLCNASGTEVGAINKTGFYYGVKPDSGFDNITTFVGTKINASSGLVLTGNRKVEIYEDELESASVKTISDAKGISFSINTSFAYGDKQYQKRGQIELVVDDTSDFITHLRIQASNQLLLDSSDVCFKGTNISVMSGTTEYHGYSGTISTGSKSLRFMKGLLVSAT